MKKKERLTLKLAVNGIYSKKTWKKLKFYSKNKKVVKTNTKGKLTAKKKGTTKITIRAKKGKAKTTLKVIVGTKIRSVRMNAAAQNLLVGDSVQLTATVTPKKASYKKLRWTSSDPAVAVVANGKVNAVAEGTATITAAALDGTKKKAVCQIVVRKSGGGTQPPGTSGDPKATPPVDSSAAPASTPSSSDNPSVIETPMPSEDPTVTAVPGGTQTEKPGTDPTDNPTANPTNKPTSTPIDKPTGEPTSVPTSKPTVEPTAAPGATATVKPGAVPTGKPTVTPAGAKTMKPTAVPTGKPTNKPTPTPEPVSLFEKNFHIDGTTMTKTGEYAGNMLEPFEGVALYGNGDGVKISYRFEGTNKKYRIIVKGASNNDTAAGVSLYIGDQKKGAVSFTDRKSVV